MSVYSCSVYMLVHSHRSELIHLLLCICSGTGLVGAKIFKKCYNLLRSYSVSKMINSSTFYFSVFLFFYTIKTKSFHCHRIFFRFYCGLYSLDIIQSISLYGVCFNSWGSTATHGAVGFFFCCCFLTSSMLLCYPLNWWWIGDGFFLQDLLLEHFEKYVYVLTSTNLLFITQFAFSS